MKASLTAIKAKFFSPIIIFSLIIFLISLHDGIISYVSPIIISNNLNDTFMVGLILSVSSTFGMLFNFVIAQFFSSKTYRFFFSRMLFFAICIPLIFLFLPRSVFPFIIAMIVWSVYYEFRNYSKFDFVHKNLPYDKNTEAWATMSIFQSAAYMLGPIITLYLLQMNAKFPLYASLLITTTAIFFYVFFSSFRKKPKRKELKKEENIKSFFKEVSIIKILFKRIWPLVIFCFSITILDVAFWTTGILYSESLRTQNYLGGFILTAYCLPSVFVGVITPYIHGNLGKKRTSFICGVLASIGLVLIGLTKNIAVMLGLIFITATFADIAFILVFATFEDYITRLDEGGTDLVSIGQFAQNLAYSIGPILLGFVSRGNKFGVSFIVAGVILLVSSLFALFVVPRKIRMPHKELARELK